MGEAVVTGATSTRVTEGATEWVAEATRGADETGECPLLGLETATSAGDAGTRAEACLLRVLKAGRRDAVEAEGALPPAVFLLVQEATGAEGASASFSSEENPASMNCGIHGAGAAGSSCLLTGSVWLDQTRFSCS